MGTNDQRSRHWLRRMFFAGFVLLLTLYRGGPPPSIEAGVELAYLDPGAGSLLIQVLIAAFASAAGGMRGVLEYSEDPLVSSDVVGNPHSSVIDGLSTMVMNGNLIKVVSWYDNEWAYSNRVIELMMLSNQMELPAEAATAGAS